MRANSVVMKAAALVRSAPAAGGGVAYRAGSAVQTNIPNTASPVITAPSGLQDGDLVIIAIALNASPGDPVTMSNGFSEVSHIATAAVDSMVTVIYKIASGEPATWTFTNLFAAANTGVAAALAYTGAHAAPLSGTPTATAPASTADLSCTAMTPGDANCMIFGVFGCDPSNASQTCTSGWGTERADFQNGLLGQIYVVEKLQSGGPSAETPTATASNADNYGNIAFAMKPA